MGNLPAVSARELEGYHPVEWRRFRGNFTRMSRLMLLAIEGNALRMG